MKYALLLYAKDSHWKNLSDEERAAEYDKHVKFGELLDSRNAARGGEELALSHTATTLRHGDGEVLASDGPYAETAEQLGGFYLIEAADLDEALELAKSCPGPIVEVRPIVEM
ncbi:hypothetical protein FB566_0034 [Stackebrandtia endophytica]|uniref:YCII-related domain-containing protein n=1 Tax=Stackebrandtia endophytica TaxID=1496996 RepID=A0A543APQ7_9ACTN|nr:YciI family protein [Stackebrandtia endophytica]TQL74549.1 hypothetical protein FB566_0034 [Stackebrandtia endophytica]